jgi:transketolase
MGSTPAIIGQRDAYFEALFEIFKADKDCVIITADNGAPSLDQFADLPGQFYTVGIAEQAMMAMAAGMALEGKRVWVYAIAPFVTTRVHEFVKLDICAQNLPVTILGVGAGLAYDNMGASHHTLEDIAIMRALPGLEIYSPADAVCAAALVPYLYKRQVPAYIRFDRAGIPNLYVEKVLKASVAVGYVQHEAVVTPEFTIIATGIMVHQALKVAKTMARDIAVFDIYRLWPFPLHLSTRLGPIVTLEEHFLAGGLGSIVSEALHDGAHSNSLLRLGVPARYTFLYGGRERIWKEYSLDVDSIVDKIIAWL